jgi:hypothetical protein
MVAVQQPRADCGHGAALTQRCGKCLQWCCPECYAPWTALACRACRDEARLAAVDPYAAGLATLRVGGLPDPPPVIEPKAPPQGDPRCRDRSRSRGVPSPHRHRERADVRSLAARVADLERRLQELRPGS